jgi:hypothetical protein
MVLDVIAMICVGAGTAGLYLLLRKVLGKRMPSWALPAVIGAAMLGFSIWNEYTWHDRVTAALPDGIEVLLSPADRSPFRPWTYLVAPSTRFMALDRTAMRVSAENPAYRQADLMFVERWMPTQRVAMAFDCKGNRHADLMDGAILAPDGTLTGSDWIAAEPSDLMQAVACREE